MRRVASKSAGPLEHDIQAAIIEAIEWAGFTVCHTSAFKQKGASGVSKGIPDLLVSTLIFPYTYFGIEVKRNAAKPVWSSVEQRMAAQARRFIVVDNPRDALLGVKSWLEQLGGEPAATKRLLEKIDRVLRGLGG